MFRFSFGRSDRGGLDAYKLLRRGRVARSSGDPPTLTGTVTD